MSVVEETTSGSTRVPEAADPPGRRGRVGVHAVAFGLMLGAGVALAASSLGSLRSMGLLWLSAVLSAAAIGAAIVSLLLPRRS